MGVRGFGATVAEAFEQAALALGGRQAGAAHGFAGSGWRAPGSIGALVAFALGCAIGVLAMVPSWWRQRRVAQRTKPAPAPAAPASTSIPVPSQFGAEAAMPPRENL